MEENKNRKLDKYAGAILGAAVGDALGWPYEQNSKNISKKELKDKGMFQKWIRRDGGRFWSHDEEINPGEYSDDTQLIIATARSLRYGDSWSKNFTKIELPAWLSYERGGGGATKRAAQAWKRGNSPWDLAKEKRADVEKYFNAGGNGVAMRILPHIFNKEGNFDEVMHQVILNGIFTHGHPRALIGATVYADALMYLLNKEKILGYGELVDYLITRKDVWGKFPNIQKIESWFNAAETVLKNKYMSLWDDVAEEVISLLRIVKEGLEQGALDMGNEVLEKLGCFNKNINGAGTVTAVAAIYLASKYASSPRLGLIEAASLKNADTDTLASMVGGLLGMIHGQEFLSASWIDLQDYDFLVKLIHLETVEYNAIKAPIFDYDNSQFKAKLKQIKIGDQITVLPFGQLTLKDRKLNKANLEGSVINTLKLVSDEGQSIFIKTYEKDVEKKDSKKQEKIENQNISQQTVIHQEKQVNLVNNVVTNNNYNPVLTAKKIRVLVNLLPNNISSSLCFTFIADVMLEMERSGNGEIDSKGMKLLYYNWGKYGITAEHITKIKDIIKYY